ncbi:hypothetical protein FV229_08645 [Methylobacterium sp. WL120]|nr:hypothetical protein FV229_08645 [Methylobacterium sp. WL120]
MFAAPSGPIAGPLSRSEEGQGEGRSLSGEVAPLTPTLSRTGEGAAWRVPRLLRQRTHLTSSGTGRAARTGRPTSARDP